MTVNYYTIYASIEKVYLWEYWL